MSVKHPRCEERGDCLWEPCVCNPIPGLAMQLYEAYRAHREEHEGDNLPPWFVLSDRKKERFVAVAKAALAPWPGRLK
jgi:hypothetical protein